MTAATLTLTDFLLARIAEDGAAVASDSHHLRECACMDDVLPFPCDCGRPARVLAECEAKRQIVELHNVTSAPGTEAWDPVCTEEACLATPDGCEELRILAAIYADHPDYRDEWKI